MKFQKTLPIICCLALVTLLSQDIKAQEPFFKASIIAGPNFCQVDGDRFSGYNKVGFHGGIRVSHNLNERWTTGFELLYSTKGSKRKLAPDDPNPQIFVLKAQYVEMPLVGFYHFKQVKGLLAIGGLSIGVNTGGTVDDGITTTEANFKRSEIAFLLGGEYKLTDNVSIALRHSTSLFRIGDQYQNGRNWFYRVGLYNRLYMLSAVIGLGK